LIDAITVKTALGNLALGDGLPLTYNGGENTIYVASKLSAPKSEDVTFGQGSIKVEDDGTVTITFAVSSGAMVPSDTLHCAYGDFLITTLGEEFDGNRGVDAFSYDSLKVTVDADKVVFGFVDADEYQVEEILDTVLTELSIERPAFDLNVTSNLKVDKGVECDILTCNEVRIGSWTIKEDESGNLVFSKGGVIGHTIEAEEVLSEADLARLTALEDEVRDYFPNLPSGPSSLTASQRIASIEIAFTTDDMHALDVSYPDNATLAEKLTTLETVFHAYVDSFAGAT
jgi:hypothetical protein